MIVARRTASKALAGRAVSSLSSPLTCLKKNMPVFLGKTSDLHAVFDTETTHLSKKTPPAGATDMYSCPCTAAWTSAPSVTSLPRGAGHTDGKTSGSAISVVRQYQRKLSSSCKRKQFFSSQSFSAGVMDLSFKLKSFVQTTSATL